MKDFFEGIASLFDDLLFLPLDALRELQDESWWAANGLNWIFILVVFVAFLYWMKQLKNYNENDQEDRSVKAHPFLGKNAELD
ncbi:MAG: uracil phosphoribosyltransferase [Psychroflexus sp.]